VQATAKDNGGCYRESMGPRSDITFLLLCILYINFVVFVQVYCPIPYHARCQKKDSE